MVKFPTYLGVRPTQAESSLMRKQLAEAKHQTVDKREEQVDSRTAQKSPDTRRFVEDDWRAFI